MSIINSTSPLATVDRVLAADGAWTWFNDPRALFHGGRLYFGYVKRSSTRPALSVHDPETGRITEMFEIDFSCENRDDHDNPAIAVLPDGRLFVSAATHDATRSFYYRLSRCAKPLLPEDWEEQAAHETPEAISYQNPFVLTGENNRLYNFHRCIGWNPSVALSEDGGRTWSAIQRFIAAENRRRPYIKFASNGEDRIDVIYTDGHPRTVDNSVYHCYIQGGHIHQTCGTVIKSLSELPLRHEQGEQGSVVYAFAASSADAFSPAGKGWIWDITRDAKGHPVCLFQTRQPHADGGNWKETRIHYYYACWTPATGWQSHWMARAGRPLYDRELDYGGGMSIDPADSRIVYISSNAGEPFDLAGDASSLRRNDRYEIYRGITHDGGVSFAWTPVTADSRADNIRPYVPRGDTPRGRSLLWLNGRYDSYTDFHTRVMGRFSSSPSAAD